MSNLPRWDLNLLQKKKVKRLIWVFQLVICLIRELLILMWIAFIYFLADIFLFTTGLINAFKMTITQKCHHPVISASIWRWSHTKEQFRFVKFRKFICHQTGQTPHSLHIPGGSLTCIRSWSQHVKSALWEEEISGFMLDPIECLMQFSCVWQFFSYQDKFQRNIKNLVIIFLFHHRLTQVAH